MTKKYNVKPEQAQVLEELGRIIGKSIPFKEKIKSNMFGVKVSTVFKHSGFYANVIALGLSKQGLSTLPESIGKLTSLQILYLGKNDLTTLPESIGKLTSLRNLDLSNNNLTTLPGSIGNLKNLKILDLMQNQLSTLPESIGNLKSLEKLNLFSNKFSTLPLSIWPLENLGLLQMNSNPLDNESKEMVKNWVPAILKFCRERATIKIFISHAVADYKSFRIKEISEYLEQQDEIYDAYHCEEDLRGDIDDFMNDMIPKCQLLLFFASRKSVFDSPDCAHELELARTHKIQIIPIKGVDVNWEDLQGIGLGRERGYEFEGENFEAFFENLYDTIKKFKREVNLFDPERAKIDKQVLNLKNTIVNFIDSEVLKEDVKENLEQFENLFQKLTDNKISPLIYSLKCLQILSEKTESSSENKKQRKIIS